MKAQVFESALGAAARVAFSVALFSGCSAHESTDAKSQEGDQENDALTSSAAAEKGSNESLACCEKNVKNIEVPFDADAAVFNPYGIDPTKVTPAIADCCEVILDAADKSLTGIGWDLVSDCCYGVPAVLRDEDAGMSVPRHSACTPWGPPVPPAMPSYAQGVA